MTSLMMIRGGIRLGVSFIFDKDFHPYADNLDLSVSEENFPKNLKLVDTLISIAEEKGITASQLTLSWLLAQGDDIFPVRAFPLPAITLHPLIPFFLPLCPLTLAIFTVLLLLLPALSLPYTHSLSFMLIFHPYHSPLYSLPTPLHIETNTPPRSQAPLPSPASTKTTLPQPSTSTTKRQQKSEKHVKRQLYMEQDIPRTF